MWRIIRLFRILERIMAEAGRLGICCKEPELVVRHAANIMHECNSMADILRQMYKEEEVKQQ